MSTGTLNSNQILVPSRTRVYLGEVGATVPTDPAADPGAGWFNVGHTTEDSLSFETSPEFEEFRSAQSDYAVKKFQTSDAATVQVDLAQWNARNFQAIYGGGTVTVAGAETPNVYKFTPPRIGERTELAALVHVKEGSKDYLYVFPKAAQSEGVAQALNKGATVTLPLRLDVLGGDSTDPWYLLTNDPAFAPETVPAG